MISYKPLRKLFPPVVTSLVIISIGLSLLPVGINYFGGGSGAADFGDPKHLLVGTFVILVIIIAKQIKGFVNNASILIGIIAGYILAIVLGMVDFYASSNSFLACTSNIYASKNGIQLRSNYCDGNYVYCDNG